MEIKNNINNSYRKYYYTDKHIHKVTYLTSEEKNYSIQGSGWICDICKTNFKLNESSMHCLLCEFDVCNLCFYYDQFLE